MNPNTISLPAQMSHGAPPMTIDGNAISPPAKPGKLLRLPSVEDRVGAKRSSIYAWCKAGTFPAPVRLSARAVAWREDDIDRWIAARTTTGGQS